MGIAIDFSQDPLTVVSRGAAVFASTQQMDSKLQKKAAVGEFQVQISDKYKPVGHESDPLIAGKVLNPDGTPTAGFTLEFVNPDTKWRSGKLPLNVEGGFFANLLAEKGSRNTFQIELSDGQGNLQKAVPDHVVYTIGSVIEEQPLIKSIGLGKADNTVDWFFKAGMGLPQTKSWPTAHKTTVALKAGQPGDAIKIPIVEGEHEFADRNRLVGYLEIGSSEIRRDLPVGSDVEIKLKINESRTIILDALIPLLDEEFSKPLEIEKQTADAGAITETLRKEKQRLNELKEKAEEAGDAATVEELERLESDKDRADTVRAAKGDPGAAEKAQAQVLEMQNQLDAAEKKLQWPTLVAEARELQTSLGELADEHGNVDHQDKVEDWSEAIDSIIDKKQTERLPRKLDEGHSIHAQILFSLPGFWVGNFQRMERDRGQFSDADAAERLFERGREYLQKDNIEGLQDVVRKLWGLLPKEEAERAQRGVGSNVI
jgi:molecular chaperone DnaK